jgi:dipeptidyl aminopeptidase/acylaminoacyl peptidase
MRVMRVAVLVSCVAGSHARAQIPAKPARPLNVDDVLRLQALRDWDVATGHGDVAVVVTRSALSPQRFDRSPALAGLSGADIVVIPASRGALRHITDGARDSSGAFLPLWSPDGRRLAFVSASGANCWLSVWDRATGKAANVAQVAVDVFNAVVDGGDGRLRPFIWLNDSTILAAQLPDGIAPWSGTTPDVATGAWKRERGGVLATGSAVESPHDTATSLRGSLRAINVVRGTTVLVASYPFYSYGETRLSPARYISLSPDRKRVAILALTGTVPLTADRTLGRGNVRTRVLGIARLDRPSNVQWLESRMIRQIGHWAPDGARLSVSTVSMDTLSASDGFAVVTMTGAAPAIEPLRPSGFIVARAVFPLWDSSGTVLIFGHDEATTPTGTRPRNDWWTVHDDTRSNVTTGIPHPPSELIRSPSGFVGLSDGALWRIDPSRGMPVPLIGGKEITLTDLVWPGIPATRQVSALLSMGEVNGETHYYRIDLSGNAPSIADVAPPSRDAIPVAYNDEARVIAFQESGRRGTFLWRASTGNTPAVRALAVNEFLADIADSRRILFSYSAADGKQLKGLLLLPVGYDGSKRYPTVVSVYAGDIVRDTTEAPKNDADWLNLNLLAAHGYVVLIPSMPLAPYGVPMANRMRALPDGVMTAVRRAVAMGVVDSARVGVMGFSYGGYSVYSLVTQTTDFKAAVAIAGPVELISLYGEFPANRYGAHPHEQLFGAVGLEGGWAALGGTPWTNVDSYVKNSPFYLLDRVTTPTLILHGDLDGAVPISQSEQAFTALYRLGKRARFVRYWGETHGFSSPANVRDVWREVFAWLDKNLAPVTR